MNVLRNSWNPQLPAELLKFGRVRVDNRHSRDADNACLRSRGTGIILFVFRNHYSSRTACYRRLSAFRKTLRETEPFQLRWDVAMTGEMSVPHH